MIKRIAAAIAASLCLLWLTGTASAADYKAGWGQGLSENEVSARVLLKQAAERLCESGDTDLEKVRKLNRYVCDLTRYDDASLSGSLAELVYRGRALCSGYAEALSYLLDCAGVKNFKITAFIHMPDGSRSLHVWNAVFVDGTWFHVDPTWNDATISGAHPDGKYFMLTCETMGAERQIAGLSAAADYDRMYRLLRTVTVSFGKAGVSGEEKQASLPVSASGKKEASAPSLLTQQDAFLWKEGKLLAPAREMIFALGGYVMEDGNTLSLLLGTKTLQMTAGSSRGVIDSEEITFDVAPQVIGGKTMVPLRAVLEALGASVTYNEKNGEVTAAYDPYLAN